MFGSTQPRPTFGGFGTTTPAFGAPAFGATTTPAFGASSTPAFGGTSTPAFGATAAPAFGATTTPAFGAPSTPAFGAPQPTSAFGAPSTPFGASATPAFGAPAATTTPAFGASTTPAFGGFGATAQPSAFGAPAATTGFGATAPSTFGATQPAFGATTTPAFGATTSSFAFGTTPSTFGSTPASPFQSQPATTGTMFGASTTPSPFGGTTTPAGSMFGAATGGGFGMSTFGQTTTTPATSSPFGQPAATTTPAQQTGTGNPKYQPTSETDQNGTVNHQAITAMAAYNKKSFEELRWEDYQAGKKNAQAAQPMLSAQPTPSFGGFGATTATTTTTTPGFASIFPTATTTPNPFGATPASPSPFGTTTAASASPFGATQPPATSAFGPTTTSTTPSFTPFASTTPSPFGAPAPTASPFGATTQPFSTSTAPATTSIFPSTTTSSPFGAATQPTTTTPSFQSFFSSASTSTTPSPFGVTAAAPLFSSTPSLTAQTTPSIFSTSTTSATAPASSFTLGGFGTLGNPTPTTTFPSLSTTPTLNFATTSLTSTATPPPNPFAPLITTAPTTSLLGGLSTLGTAPTVAAPTISSPPVSVPLPVFSVPNGTPAGVTHLHLTNTPGTPSAPIPTLTFTQKTPSTPPPRNTFVSSYHRSLPSRSLRIKDSPSYNGRLFSDDKLTSPSGIHITPENLTLRTGTPSRPRVDIKRLNLPPFEVEQRQQQIKQLQEKPKQIEAEPAPHFALPSTPTSVPQTPEKTPITPAASVVRVTPDAPTLRNPHYFTKPTMDVLKEMNSEELSRVEDFTVGCENLGFVRWHGKTDVRGLNLDDIVQFEKKAVTVYPEQGIYPKPREGEGLNRPATITLFNVFPKKPETADKYSSMIANTTKKLGAKLLNYDPVKGVWEFEVAHFSRYGLMEDEEEEEEQPPVVVQPPKPPPAVLPSEERILPPHDTAQREKGTGLKALELPPPTSSLVPVSPLPPSAPTSTLPTFAQPPPSYLQPDAKSRPTRLSQFNMRGVIFTADAEEEPMAVERPVTVLRKPKAPAAEPSVPFSQSFIAQESERLKKAVSPRPAPRTPFPVISTLPPEEETELIVRAPQLRLKLTPSNQSVSASAPSKSALHDMGLMMGRSFRVGWGPNGRLLRTTGQLGVLAISTPPISTRNTAVLPPSDVPSLVPQASQVVTTVFPDRYMLEMLQTHLAHSTPQYGPSFVLKDPDANIQANIKICDPGNEINASNSEEKDAYQQHLFLVWTLIYALWGKINEPSTGGPSLMDTRGLIGNGGETDDGVATTDASGERLSTHMLRKLLVSKWLSQALVVPVEESVKVAKTNGNTILAILHHLAGRQISPAVALAQRSRDYRLAVLLTQTWTFSLQLLGAQIEQWEATNSTRFMDPYLLNVYKLLSGDVESVAKDVPKICEDWLRSFALHFWYKHSPSTPIPSVINTYDAAVSKACATAPFPPYRQPPQKRTPNPIPSSPSSPATPKDTLYWLLQLYASTSPKPHLPLLPDESEVDDGTPLSHAVATPTSSLPIHLLLAVVNPANITRDPLDFSLAWHLYTVLRAIPALSSVVDLQGYGAYRLHTSYAAQLEMSGQWQWAIYVLLHVNFESYKTALNGEWGFGSGRRAAIVSILERHAAEITDRDQQFLAHQLHIPSSWIDGVVGRYKVFQGEYTLGVQKLLRAGEWNEAHRVVLQHIVPAVLVPNAKETEKEKKTAELVNFLETLKQYSTYLADPTWNMGGEIYLSYLNLFKKLGPVYPDDSKNNNGQLLVEEIAGIYALCELVTQWGRTQNEETSLPDRVSASEIATYIGYLLLALANSHRDPAFPSLLHSLPLPPDVRADIMEDYVHTMVYSV